MTSRLETTDKRSVYKRYLSTAEPLILYVGLVFTLYFVGISHIGLWIKMVVATVYNLVPILIIKRIHHKRLAPALGVKVGIPLVLIVVVAGAASILSLFQDKSLDRVYSVVLAPVGEEVFFRGYLLRNLRKYGRNRALAATALMFATSHFLNVPLTEFAFFQFSVFGLLFGAGYLYFNSILYPILWHQTVNMSIDALGPFGPPYLLPFPWNYVGYVVSYTCLAGFVLSFLAFARREMFGEKRG